MFYCYFITVVPIFPSLTFSAHSTPNSHSQCPSVIHTCSSASPFPFFSPLYPSPSLLVTVSLFHVSMLLVLFCLLVYFVHQIPFMVEIIEYMSFTDWLISLSIMLSSSIHAVSKGTSAGEVVEKREAQCTVGGNADWCSHCRKQYGISSKKN